MLAVLCLVSPGLVFSQSLVIPQVADGAGWQTTIVLTNTTASPVSASLTCYQETSAGNTQSWPLPLLEAVSPSNLSLTAAGTLFLQTSGTASSTSVGWCQIQAPSTVVSYAIFTSSAPGRSDQEGTASAASSANRILIPFDNTVGSVTSLALVNPTATSETISASIQTDAGTISQASLPPLPAQGHTAFALSQQFPATAGHRGLAELYASNGSIASIALAFGPSGSFTTAPVYPESGTPIIGASGGSISGGGSSTLPAFNSISLTTTYTPNNQVNYPIAIFIKNPAAGGYSYGVVDTGNPGLGPTPTVIGFEAYWTSVTLSGATLSFSGLLPGAQTAMVDNNGKIYPITSASLTLTLVPQGSGLTGTASGSLTVVSSLSTLTGIISGTYVGNQ